MTARKTTPPKPDDYTTGALAAEDAGELDDGPAADEKSEPKPGDADYDWTPHYPDGVKLFRHTYPDGQVVAIREFKAIHSKQWLRQIRNLPTEFDVESAAVERAACPTALEVIDAQPADIDGPDAFAELWDAWKAADLDEAVDSGE